MKCFNLWMVSHYSSRHLCIINRKHHKEMIGKSLVRGPEEKPFCTCCPWEALKGKLGRGVPLTKAFKPYLRQNQFILCLFFFKDNRHFCPSLNRKLVSEQVIITFFALVPTFSTNSHRNTFYTGSSCPCFIVQCILSTE